jgi:hypothetical protein
LKPVREIVEIDLRAKRAPAFLGLKTKSDAFAI